MNRLNNLICLEEYMPHRIYERAVMLDEGGDYTAAIDEYKRYLKFKPGDLRARNKLADAFVRLGYDEMAFPVLKVVVDGYVSGGFYLKALAAAKRMLRIDPGNIELIQKCAEINIKQGLLGNAISEYRELEKLLRLSGRKNEARQVEEIMTELESEFEPIREFSFDDSYLSGISEFNFDEPDFSFDDDSDDEPDS